LPNSDVIADKERRNLLEGNDVNILIVNGHPRAGSFSDAITKILAEEASRACASVEVLTLRDLNFDHDVLAEVGDLSQPVEPDIQRARELLSWCEHLVIVFPTWWAGTPALLKGFLDRLLSSGFAFEETTGGTGYRGLLGPRAARVITTMDTPWRVYRWIYGRPVFLAMKRCTLGFCGLSPVRVTTFAAVKDATPEIRADWLAEVAKLARRTVLGPSRLEAFTARAKVWLQAMRLQFYLMTLLAYVAGALGAARELSSALHWSTFAFGYGFLFFIEVATVFANDVFDFESDRQNEFYGPFSGGSRVLVDGKLTRNQLGLGAMLALVLGVVFGGLAVAFASGSSVASATVLFAIGILATGYTVVWM